MSKLNILIGADPEVFMRKDGVLVSAHGAVQGTKAAPFKVMQGAVQVDGMALEFNIDPASSSEEFVNNIQTVMAELARMVPGYELVADPVAEFGLDYIKAQPKEAQEMGCEPDYNAWLGGAINPKPDGEKSFRTGAGHVHIGWTKDMDITDPSHKQACIMLTRQLDYYLGIGSMLYDGDIKRRTMYGAAGAFRVKPYGVEYRVLSNAWLKSPKLMSWVFDCTVKAVNDLLGGREAFQMYGDAALHIMQDPAPMRHVLTDYLKLFGLRHPEV